mmetsp:Transcript_19821/g.24993  ORF Transcript_19821/g.24993 Transcript_19821/m.24993 type:complete len:297 (+) Transcript_19821:137-1027(+)
MISIGPFSLFNILNVVAFLISWALNSEVDLGPEHEFWNFLNGMRELGRRYESIVTPAGTTFLIAHFVLLFQGIFAVAQLLPNYRNSPLVQEGVSFWFLVSIIGQLFWCMNFGLENWFGAIMSVVYLGAVVFANSRILIKQSALTDESQLPEEYWLLRFPFSLHTGWIMTLFVMSINGFVRFLELGNFVQLIFGFLSLIFYVLISWKMLLANGEKANYAIPSIIAWVVLGIVFDAEPKGEMDDYFSLGFSVISGLVGVGIGGFTAFLFYKDVITKKDDEKVGENGSTSYVAPSSDLA